MNLLDRALWHVAPSRALARYRAEMNGGSVTVDPRMPSNWLDRAVGYVSPQRGLGRVKARAAMGLMERYTERFGYEGATAGRRAHGWYSTSADANVELMGSLVWLRNRSRDLVRNNRYASKGIEELVGNAVGTGIMPQAQSGDTALDKIIDKEWPYFALQCDTPQRVDFYGMQALVLRSMAESGEMVIRYRQRLASDNLRVPLQLQLLESDFLDHYRTMGMVNGHVMQGVQFDMLGRRVAYWLYSYHPGGVLILNPRGGIISQPVPADQVIHTFRQLRPGQVRGVPWMAPVMMALRDLDDYEDAERVRKKIEACMMAFVTQADGADGPALGSPDTSGASFKRLENFEPGMVKYLENGEEVNFSSPPSIGGYREYKMCELQGIAAGMNLPYELMSGDMSQVNYSSWRGGMLGMRNLIEGYRWLTLIPQFCQPVRRRFIDTLVLQGKIPARYIDSTDIDLYQTQWTAPKWESVDPLKDAMATTKEIRIGTRTLAQAIQEAGYDPRTQLAEIARLNAMLDALDIILDCDPRNTTDKGLEQPAASAEARPDPVDKPQKAPPKKKLRMIAGDAEHFARVVRETSDALDGLKGQAVTQGARPWSATSRLYLM